MDEIWRSNLDKERLILNNLNRVTMCASIVESTFIQFIFASLLKNDLCE